MILVCLKTISRFSGINKLRMNLKKIYVTNINIAANKYLYRVAQKKMEQHTSCNMWMHRRTRRGGGGGAAAPPRIFQIAIFGEKQNHVIFGQNHLIFGQAMEKIFGQLISAPPKRKWSPTPMCGCNNWYPCVR